MGLQAANRQIAKLVFRRIQPNSKIWKKVNLKNIEFRDICTIGEVKGKINTTADMSKLSEKIKGYQTMGSTEPMEFGRKVPDDKGFKDLLSKCNIKRL